MTTDAYTLLIAVCPAAVTGFVAYQAARMQSTVAESQVQARLSELEHNMRRTRRDELATVFSRFMSTELELNTRVGNNMLDAAWYEEWHRERFGPANAAVALFASEAVFTATKALFDEWATVLRTANELVRQLPALSYPDASRQAYEDSTDGLRGARNGVRDAMRGELAGGTNSGPSQMESIL